MPGEDAARVLDANGALEHRLDKVSGGAEDSDDSSADEGEGQAGVEEEVVEEGVGTPADEHSQDDAADEAFDSLLG